jgi:hypothetical protein
MVQNPIDPPRITNYPPSFPVARKRARSNSQPIQPLKLPTISNPNPVPPRSDQFRTEEVPTSHPTVNGAIPERGVVQINRTPLAQDISPANDLSDRMEDPLLPPVPSRQPSVHQSQQPPAKAKSKPAKAKPRPNPLLPIQRFAQATRSRGMALAMEVSIASVDMYRAVAPKVIESSQRLKPNSQTQQWMLIWFSILGTFSGITALAFVWLASPPPSANCRRVSLDSPGVQRLYCAQSLVQSGELPDLVAGIELVENWSPDQPFYRDAQQSIADWSALILVIARGRMAQSDLAGAIEAVNQIPESSPVYSQGQEAIATWQQEWQSGEAIVALAQEAIQAQNWRQASQQVVELGYLSHEYWRLQQADVLFKQVVREKTARESLTHAQKLAKENSPDKLAEAIALLRNVAPGTYATAEAEAALQQWSQTLIAVGLEQWQQGDREGAFATAQAIPLNPDLPTEGRDLIQISQAIQLAETSLGRAEPVPSIAQVWQLMEAITATQNITPSSPFYQDAQTAMQTWQAHLQDLNQLFVANAIAGWGDRRALELAIAKADHVTDDRPRRSQAQTLIADWHLTMQGLEDQPFLARAEKWTRSGKIPDLQAAIAQLKVIPSDRPAWKKAQQLMAEWTAQIQTIEDQPFWDKAQKLAKQGKLPEAIDTAAKIQPNRALYEQAQSEIAAWKGEIRAAEIAEDQPILDRAYGLAAQQRLTMAIDAAAQIGPGRALYSEAQAAISAWSQERDFLWKVWADEPIPASEAEAIDAQYDDRADGESD